MNRNGNQDTPTLRDIAEALDVNVSTVSRIVNGGSINVRPETRERVLAEAKRRGYRPHAAARSLKVQRTGALGLLIPDVTNLAYAAVVRGAVRRADELGYVVLMAEVRESTRTDVLSRFIDERRVDGVIIASGEQADTVAELEIPHLFVNRRVAESGPSVTIDDEAAARTAAGALLAAGHRRLAFIGDDDGIDTAHRRRAGFMAACREAGVDDVVDVVAPYSRPGGVDAMERLLATVPRPTGVFASNFLVALGALTAAHRANVQVPEDISIVTLNAEDAAYTEPPLTAVDVPLTEMGETAVDEMHRILQGSESGDVVIATPPRLIERASLRPPRA